MVEVLAASAHRLATLLEEFPSGGLHLLLELRQILTVVHPIVTMPIFPILGRDPSVASLKASSLCPELIKVVL